MNLHAVGLTIRILEERADEGGRFDRLFPLRRVQDLKGVHTTIHAKRVHLMVGRDVYPLVRLARKARVPVTLADLEPRIGETAVAWLSRCLDYFEARLVSRRAVTSKPL